MISEAFEIAISARKSLAEPGIKGSLLPPEIPPPPEIRPSKMFYKSLPPSSSSPVSPSPSSTVASSSPASPSSPASTTSPSPPSTTSSFPASTTSSSPASTTSPSPSYTSASSSPALTITTSSPSALTTRFDDPKMSAAIARLYFMFLIFICKLIINIIYISGVLNNE